MMLGGVGGPDEQHGPRSALLGDVIQHSGEELLR